MHMPTDTHKLSGSTQPTYQRISNGQCVVGLGLHSLAPLFWDAGNAPGPDGLRVRDCDGNFGIRGRRRVSGYRLWGLG